MPYKPETLYSYEVGAKISLLDKILQVNTSGFYYDYKNFQAYQFIDLTTHVINRPAKVYGGELETTLRLTENFKISTSGSYTHNRVSDVPVNDVVKDRIAPYTSKWQAMIGVERTFDVLGGSLELGVASRYTGSFFYSISNFSSTRVKGYWLENAHVSWTSDPPDWTLAITAENLLNEKYRTVGFDLTSTCGCSSVAYGRPQWFGAYVTRKF